MQPSLDTTNHAHARQWVYASLTVIDGRRHIKPAQVASDRLLFISPPRLTSGTVEIIITNGDQEQRHTAVVLPHDAEATRIPIRLLGPD
jgi:hypothetical protein